jgi:hypothetical protein
MPIAFRRRQEIRVAVTTSFVEVARLHRSNRRPRLTSLHHSKMAYPPQVRAFVISLAVPMLNHRPFNSE